MKQEDFYQFCNFILEEDKKRQKAIANLQKVMKINQLRYSQIESTVQSKKLFLSFDDNEKDENLFKNKKSVSKIVQKAQTKMLIKNRPLSANNKQMKNVQDDNSRSFLNSDSPTPVSMRRSQKNYTDSQQFKARPRTVTNRFFTRSEQKNSVKHDIFLQLSKQIKNYFGSIITSEEKKETLQQLKLILNILQKQTDPSSIFQKLQKLEDHLSRFLRHRISHLYFYLIYCKFHSSFSNQPLEKEIKLLSLAEYHARSFYFRKVALLICLEIQQKYIKMNNFEQSRKYAIKSLKLAVLVDDRYEQVKMLEYLGVLKFYEGILNSRGNNLLTQEERFSILKHYKQEQEIPKIFNFIDLNTAKSTNQIGNKQNHSSTNQLKTSFDPSRVYFNQGQNFVQNDIPSSNLKKFNRNFHGINKKIGSKNQVKETIKKINQVGEVKKFIGKDNFITLYPQGNSIKSKHQIQVLVTHKKYTQIEKGRLFFKKFFPLIISNLEALILSETC